MKLRDTVILVVLAHVGLVLVWICMGGCANDKAQEPKEEVSVLAPDEPETTLPETEISSIEGPISIETIPAEPIVTLPEATRPVTPAAEAVESVVEPATEEIKVVVAKGDTLWALSRKYKVSVEAIVQRNDIQDPALIREGRVLIIPGAKPAAAEPPSQDETFVIEPAGALLPGSEAIPVAEDGQNTLHRVGAGDTIWNIARKYGTTSTKIMEANNITEPTKLQVGQELRIPKGE
jgi:LysM repeat protein